VTETTTRPYIIVFNNNGMGQADPALTHKLASAYLNLLDLQDDPLPEAICFYAEGVKLAVQGSPVLEELRSLSDKGVRLIVCTTCLNFFELFDKLAVGEAGGMIDIYRAQGAAGKVVTL
jgi:intracellular sulfur oxidation DsrE/DsrF family protein